VAAHLRAREQVRRPKPCKLACPRLAAQVTGWVEQWWSPVQICARLRMEHPHDPMMWMSHETIYQSRYVQGRGELRRELARCLRTGRAKRRPRGRGQNTGQIRGMGMISERPAEADDQAVPGHWESQWCCQAALASAGGVAA
jgi:IS30 family transposase